MWNNVANVITSDEELNICVVNPGAGTTPMNISQN